MTEGNEVNNRPAGKHAIRGEQALLNDKAEMVRSIRAMNRFARRRGISGVGKALGDVGNDVLFESLGVKNFLEIHDELAELIKPATPGGILD